MEMPKEFAGIFRGAEENLRSAVQKAQGAAISPPNEWVSVEEGLPEKDGWYLVYAPGYWGNSKIYGLDGFAYSSFKHNYKVHWGIERGTGRGWPRIVTHWMPLPAPPESRPPEGGEDT